MRKNSREDINYWPSFTDVITSLFLIFTFVFLVLIIKNHFDNKEIEKLREISGKIENDLDSLKSYFNKEFKIEGPDEAGNLRIVLGENLVKFPTNVDGVESVSLEGKKVLTAVGKQIKSAFDANPSLFTITIEGYTDTQGNANDNYDLSYRRARNVMIFWYLSCGVNPTDYDITPAGFGELESKLKVKTGDNFSEPLNRRIEIRITPKFKDLMKFLQSKNNETNKVEPVTANSILQKANSFYAKNDWKNAVIYLRQFIKIDTVDSQSRKLLAVCYEKLGNIPSAVHYYKEAIRLGDQESVLSLNRLTPQTSREKPLTAQQLYIKAEEFYYQENYKQAKEFYLKTVAVNPQNADAFWGIGYILEKFEENGIEAFEYYKKAAKLGHLAAQQKVGIK